MRSLNEILECRCKDCNKKFFLYKKDVTENEHKRKILTCPYWGKHKKIHIVNRYENIKELMEQKCGVNC